MPDFEEYEKKRNLDESSEPKTHPEAEARSGESIFVIQEHDASTHHFDFRLQVGDVLKSWALPKGPSTDPREKKLAISTEDHPLGYSDFEGTIPQDEYGGGSVIVWDRGTYQHCSRKDDEPVSYEEAEAKGHISVYLQGEKLTGGYELIKMEGENWSDNQWLFKKTDDDQADARRNPVSTEPESVLSGRTVEQVKNGEEDS